MENEEEKMVFRRRKLGRGLVENYKDKWVAR